MTKKKAFDIVKEARSSNKISTKKFINTLFNDFIELHGDHLGGVDDDAIIGGIGFLNNIPVTVIGTQKGQNIQENIKRHFGSVQPAGFRKAQRLMLQAQKFGRPIITLINTPGAYPGEDAEYHGQASAIASILQTGMQLEVPILSIIFGEAGSGGALALATGNQVWMTKNSFYSVLSPEGYASIIWRDASKADKAADKLELTPNNLLEKGIIDKIIEEPDSTTSIEKIRNNIYQEVIKLQKLSRREIVKNRAERFKNF